MKRANRLPFVIILFFLLSLPLCAEESGSQGKAKIYIYHAALSIVPINIIIDQKICAKLDGNHYTVLERDAGDLLVICSAVVFNISNIPNDAIILNVQSGKVYYLKTYGTLGGMVIKQVDEEMGRKDIESDKYGKVDPEK